MNKDINIETEYYQNTNNEKFKITKIEESFNDFGFIENNLIILTKYTLDRFLELDNPSDIIALYTFYYYTAKWQKTNFPKCVTSYVSKGLKWTETRVRKNKKTLIELGLIEDFQRKDKHNKIKGHYIKMNYIIKNNNISTLINPHRVENQNTNALSTNNINSLSINKDNNKAEPKCTLKEKIFSSKKNNISSKYINIFHDILNKNNIENKKEDSLKEKNIQYSNLYIEKYIKQFGSEEKFKQAFLESLKCFDLNYDTNKSKIPKILSQFLYFPINKYIPSNFLHYYNKPPKLIQDKKLKDKYPKYTSKLCEMLNIDINDDVISYINRLVKKNIEINNYSVIYNDKKYIREQIEPLDNIDPDYNNIIRNLDGFMQQYFYWLEEQLDNETFKFEFKFFDNNFKLFQDYIFKEFDSLSFYPKKETMINKVKNYLNNKHE